MPRVFLILAAVLAGCAPAPRAPLTSLDGLARDELVLVGKVELLPALRKGEQKIAGNVIGNFENRIYLLMDERLRPLPEEPRIADYAGRIEAPIGSTFFVRSAAAPSYVLGGILFLEMTGSSTQRVYLPGGFQVAARPGDRALYVGTLRYQRDEFFEITRVTVVDDYPAASAEFAATFGAGQVLRKALLVRPNVGTARRP